MKKAFIKLALIAAVILPDHTSQALAQAFPSLWVFEKSEGESLQKLWSEKSMPATYYGAGILSAGTLNPERPDVPYSFSGAPAIASMRQDDYFLFQFPVVHLAAGSFVEIDFSLMTEPGAPKYYVVEFLDGGQWKSMPYDLMSTEEDPQIKCTFKATGDDGTKKSQVSTMLQTLRFENEINDSMVQVRVRAVGPCTCDGSEQGGEHSRVRFVRGDNSAAYAQDLGAQEPVDTTNVLCIGNSFTYVAGASWMLKEIAWNHGHYLDVEVSLKGGQNFGQHLELSQTEYAVEFGDFAYVFLQDQSQNPARYARDRKEHAHVVDDCACLACKVRDFSPQARVFVESTWAYEGAQNGGFASVKQFDKYLAKGSRAMAKVSHAEVSPIGKAFALSRALRPDIPLYADDSKHQSEYGAYLKACVNFLTMFPEGFNEQVSTCGLDPEKAAALRAIACKVVR